MSIEKGVDVRVQVERPPGCADSRLRGPGDATLRVGRNAGGSCRVAARDSAREISYARSRVLHMAA